MNVEETAIQNIRRRVEEQYQCVALFSGERHGCFGAILCSELHHGGEDGTGYDFAALAEKWGIPVSLLGAVIADHCARLEPMVKVIHLAKVYEDL